MKPRSRPQSCGLLRRKPDREVTRLKLEFQQLRKRYGQKEALRGVSITLSEGVYLSLIHIFLQSLIKRLKVSVEDKVEPKEET